MADKNDSDIMQALSNVSISRGTTQFHSLQLTTLTAGERYPDDPISSASAHVVENVVQVGVLPVLTLCGVTLNVINMLVFLRQGLSDRINLCLFSLALADSLYLLFILITRLHSVVSLINPATGQYWKVQSLTLTGVYAGSLNVSNCLTLLISLERCFCVLWPLKAKTLISVRFTAGMILFIFSACMAGCSLSCFIYITVSYNDPLTNTTRYRPQRTAFYIKYRRLVDTIFETVFNVTLPVLSLTIVMTATVAIALRMRATLAWRQMTSSTSMKTSSSSSESSREASVTRMLVVICVLYTVCMTPYVLRALTILIEPQFKPNGRYNNTFYVAIALTHLFAATNSSLNFVVYYVMSTRYRNTWRAMIGRDEKNGRGESEQKGELTTITRASVTTTY